MRINTNVSALNTQRMLGQTNAAAATQIGRLSSGFRINRAADDAAGLGIANKLRADVRSLEQAARNAEQGNSMLQVMEGATTQISSILERMKELATQANSSTSGADSDASKVQLDAEFDALRSELGRIVDTTTFNGQTLLAGGFGTSLDTDTANSTALTGSGIYSADLNGARAGTYQVQDNGDNTMTLTFDPAGENISQTVAVGADGLQDITFSNFGVTLQTEDGFTRGGAAADLGNVVVEGGSAGSFMVSSSGSYGLNDLVSVSGVDLTAATLGIDGDSIDTVAGAQAALANLDTAIESVNTAVGDIGVAQNRMGYALQNVQATIENTAAAESTIRDADMAKEMTEFSRLQILQQAGTAMLAQANQSSQNVLQLLR